MSWQRGMVCEGGSQLVDAVPATAWPRWIAGDADPARDQLHRRMPDSSGGDPQAIEQFQWVDAASVPARGHAGQPRGAEVIQRSGDTTFATAPESF